MNGCHSFVAKGCEFMSASACACVRMHVRVCVCACACVCMGVCINMCVHVLERERKNYIKSERTMIERKKENEK